MPYSSKTGFQIELSVHFRPRENIELSLSLVLHIHLAAVEASFNTQECAILNYSQDIQPPQYTACDSCDAYA